MASEVCDSAARTRGAEHTTHLVYDEEDNDWQNTRCQHLISNDLQAGGVPVGSQRRFESQ